MQLLTTKPLSMENIMDELDKVKQNEEVLSNILTFDYITSIYYTRDSKFKVEVYSHKEMLNLANIYNKVLNVLDCDNYYVLNNQDNTLEKTTIPKNFFIKEVMVNFRKKVPNGSSKEDVKNIIFGKTENNGYFYLDCLINCDEIITNCSALVVCNNNESLLNFMATTFNIKEQLRDIQSELFKNYLDKKLPNKFEKFSKIKI